MSLKLYLLRHGQTTFSRDNAFCGAGLDPELTPDGEAMAQAFASHYRTIGWTDVYTSPLRRSVMTAQVACAVSRLEMKLRDDLKEIAYGKWEGQSVENVSRNYHDDYVRWSADPAWHAPTGGELAVAIARRALRVIEEIKEKYVEGNVLIVSHKATIRIMLCSLLGIDSGRFRYRFACPVGSVSIIEFGANGPLMHALADRSHLDEQLRNLPGT